MRFIIWRDRDVGCFMSLIETIDLHNVKEAAWRVAREDKRQVNLHLG